MTKQDRKLVVDGYYYVALYFRFGSVFPNMFVSDRAGITHQLIAERLGLA